MSQRRTRSVLAVVLLTALSGVGLADDARNKPEEPPLDDELLEFLGSVDTVAQDDGTWSEHLSQTDIGKGAAKPANPAPAPTGKPTVIAAKPATAPPAQQPSTSGAKQNE